MSNFTKGQGAKIAIKFTMPLTGNPNTCDPDAFSISAVEPQWTEIPSLDLGPLIDGGYAVENVEAYPIPVHYEEDFEGGIEDDVEVTQQELELLLGLGAETEDTYDTANLTGSTYTVIANRITFKQAGNLTKIKIKTKTSGNYTLNIKSDDGSTTHQTHTINSASADSWITFNITSLSVAVDDQYRIEVVRPSGTAYAASGLYDGTLWENREGIFGTSGFAWTNAMGFIFADPEYPLTGNYVTPAIATATFPSNLRIKWTSTTPTDTSIKVEYSLTETDAGSGTWTEVNNEDTIAINNNYLWLRYTLETTDDAVTPTLEELWLEETAADATQILLTCFPLERFQNIEGNLTVNYDSVVGNLEGLGGIVESFEQVFTPDDLVRVINPHLFELVDIGIDVTVLLNRIYHYVLGDGPWPTDDERSIKYVQEYDAGPPEVLEQQKGLIGEHNSEKVSIGITVGLDLIHVDTLDP